MNKGSQAVQVLGIKRNLRREKRSRNHIALPDEYVESLGKWIRASSWADCRVCGSLSGYACTTGLGRWEYELRSVHDVRVEDAVRIWIRNLLWRREWFVYRVAKLVLEQLGQ